MPQVQSGGFKTTNGYTQYLVHSVQFPSAVVTANSKPPAQNRAGFLACAVFEACLILIWRFLSAAPPKPLPTVNSHQERNSHRGRCCCTLRRLPFRVRTHSTSYSRFLLPIFSRTLASSYPEKILERIRKSGWKL